MGYNKTKEGILYFENDIYRLKIETEEQINFLVKMAEDIWTEHFGPILKDAKVLHAAIEANQSKEVILKQLKSDYQYYFIKIKDKVIGYFAYKLKDTELFISKIYLISEYRRKGIGRTILNYLQELAQKKKLKALTLTVYYENKIAINAYLKNGFEKVETIKRDFGDGVICTDYVMKKKI